MNPRPPSWFIGVDIGGTFTDVVPERMDARGEVVTPFTDVDALRTARRLRALRPEAISVCLLHSYANPAHEQLLADACAEVAPAIPTYISSDVSPAMREYGRA